MGTVVICIIIAALMFLAIRHIVKKGTCGGKCDGCSGSCSSQSKHI